MWMRHVTYGCMSHIRHVIHVWMCYILEYPYGYWSIGSLFLMSHFTQKRPIIFVWFADSDIKKNWSCWSSPPYNDFRFVGIRQHVRELGVVVACVRACVVHWYPSRRKRRCSKQIINKQNKARFMFIRSCICDVTLKTSGILLQGKKEYVARIQGCLSWTKCNLSDMRCAGKVVRPQERLKTLKEAICCTHKSMWIVQLIADWAAKKSGGHF